MAGFAVRHLATSRTGTRIAAAAFEHSVAIWDLAGPPAIASFETVLDFGGRRLAINDRGDLCAAAAYRRRGLACYRTATGAVAWTRTDLKQLQYLSVSADGDRLYCASDDRACAVLDFHSGTTVETLRGVRDAVESPYEPLIFLDRTRPVLRRTDTAKELHVDRTTFGFLDAAFGPGVLCLSESAGPIRAIDVESGREIWRHAPATGTHGLRLAYNSSTQTFVTTEFSFETRAPLVLAALDASSGARHEITALGSVAEAEFCLEGSAVLLSNGAVRSTMNGTILRTLPFGLQGTHADA